MAQQQLPNTPAGGHEAPAGQDARPEDLRMDQRFNRTGMGTAPLRARAMAQSTFREPDVQVGAQATALARSPYGQNAEPIGTMPPPATLTGLAQTAISALQGDKAAVLLDKVAERMAFERSGTRLYEAIIQKFDMQGSFEGGPSRAELIQIRDEEAKHFTMLRQSLSDLGGDPTAMTPSADLVAVESSGLIQAITEPRTTLAQALHAILVAELADHEGWQMLTNLAAGFGKTDLVRHFRQAQAEEAQHVLLVRQWVTAHTQNTAGITA